MTDPARTEADDARQATPRRGTRSAWLASGKAIDEGSVFHRLEVLLRQVGIGKLVQAIMAVVSVAGDQTEFGPSDKRMLVDFEPRRGLFLCQHPAALAESVIA